MSAVELHVADGVGEIVLTEGARDNPFDDVFCRELCDVANRASEDRRIRAILIRAEGRYFSVGADLKWLGRDRETLLLLLLLLKQATADLQMAVVRLARADAPVVIAVHALATGGSVALTAMADFTIAGQSASFYAACNRIGFVGDGSGSYFLPRRIGVRASTDFLMRNRTWTADEALAKGLVSEVVEGAALLPVATSGFRSTRPRRKIRRQRPWCCDGNSATRPRPCRSRRASVPKWQAPERRLPFAT